METNIDHLALKPYAAAAGGSILIWPAIGLLAALFFASFSIDEPAVQGIAIAAYVIGVFGVVIWQARRAGVQPRFETMPKPLRTNLYGFWAASTGLAVAALLISFITNFILGGVFVGLCITVGGIAYHLRARAIVAELSGT